MGQWISLNLTEVKAEFNKELQFVDRKTFFFTRYANSGYLLYHLDGLFSHFDHYAPDLLVG